LSTVESCLERGSPLKNCRIGLDHLPKQSQRAMPRTSNTTMTRTPTRLVWVRTGVWVIAPVGCEKFVLLDWFARQEGFSDGQAVVLRGNGWWMIIEGGSVAQRWRGWEGEDKGLKEGETNRDWTGLQQRTHSTNYFILRSIDSDRCNYPYMSITSPYLYTLLYGSSRLGSLGNSDARRILFSFKNNISTRSRPIPPPPCGAHPIRNASR